MKVLMSADTVGGVWTYAIELARALRPRGVDVVLATKGALPTSEQRQEAAEAAVDLRESSYRPEWQDEPWPDVQRASEWLLDLADSERPDLVHLNDYAHGSLPFAVPVLVVAHSCVLSRHHATRGEPAPPRWDRYRREVTRGLRSAHEVVAPSAAMRACLEEHYGPLARARVIHNARRACAFRPLPKEPFVLSAGRLWDEAKNVAALERIAPRLSWPVRLAGEEAVPAEGARPARAPGSGADRLGRLSAASLAEWMGRASIFAAPARYEPFGLCALEAALAGCALVLGDIPSLREVWGDAAIFVSPEDDDALAAAIETLIAQPARRRTLAHRARTRALRLDPESFADAYYRCYSDLLDRARRGMEPGRSPCAW